MNEFTVTIHRLNTFTTPLMIDAKADIFPLWTRLSWSSIDLLALNMLQPLGSTATAYCLDAFKAFLEALDYYYYYVLGSFV